MGAVSIITALTTVSQMVKPVGAGNAPPTGGSIAGGNACPYSAAAERRAAHQRSSLDLQQDGLRRGLGARLWEEANRHAEVAARRHGSRARCRLDFDNLLLGDALVAAQALLRHPPVEAGVKIPEG